MLSSTTALLVLITAFGAKNGQATNIIEFNSMASCEITRDAAIKTMDVRGAYVKAFCIPAKR